MKIIVAIKQVPERDARIRISPGAKWIDLTDVEFTLNESDAYALEEALLLKEANAGSEPSEVVVISAGPERVGRTIREALAKGADRAIHIESSSEDELAGYDALGVACLLAAAIKQEQPDLVLTGLQSDDLGLGQTGVILAELLNLPHATLILKIDKTGGGLKVLRELEDGWFQHLELPLPAVLTIQSGNTKLRYATLMGIKKAKTKEVRTLSVTDLVAADPVLQSTPTLQLEEVKLPSKQRTTQLLDGTPAKAAAKLVEKLRFEVRAI